MTQVEGWVTRSGGTQIFWRRVQPQSREARLALLFVHGLAEHSGRYLHVMRHFSARGYDCWALDYRGHGKSPGKRVHVSRFESYLDDVLAVAGLVHEEDPGRPLVFIGHSQGGLIVLELALAYPEQMAGAIVSSPFLAVHPDARPSFALRCIAQVLSVIAPSLMFPSGADPDFLSHDPGVCRAYVEDPLVSRKVSARWFTEVVKAQAATMAGARGLHVPALVMQSGADHLVDPEATRQWASTAPQELVTYVEWNELYHEMFNEPVHERVFSRMESWLMSLGAQE